MTHENLHDLRRVRGRPRDVVTPEGVRLTFVTASAGDRLVAFLLDLLAMLLLIVPLILLAGSIPHLGGIPLAFLFVAIFLVQNFYFVFFEVKNNGVTPGKRRIGLRVIDAAGGPLETDAVVVRNLMRYVEFWIPLTALLASESIWPDAPGWARVIALLWFLVFMLMPLFNRSRLRVGDLVAGTAVAVSPRLALLPDLGRARASRTGGAPEYRFTDAQLSVYGVYELQVLEDVLRDADHGRAPPETIRAVSGQIRRKIGWPGDLESRRGLAFLRAFYAAQRGYLEQRMLFGKRKKDKHQQD